QTWRHQHGEDEAAAKQARQALDDALAAAGLQEDELRRRLSRDEAWLAARRQESAALQAALATARTLAVERRRRREEHEAAAGHPSLAAEEAQAALQAAEERAAPQQQELERHKGLRTRDELERERRAALLAELGELERASAVWKTLDELIGSSDGKKLRVFAQGLTLDLLLQHANAHMREVAPRYSLMRAPDHDMALQVVDHDMGNEVRGISSLSGGESFLASLALALGLASLSSRRTPIKSLFIDEGFGSLDPHSLEQALAALESLHATGRQVGIISHLPAIAERLGVQVRVLAQGSGKSRVEVVG
ncbi:MAG: nuclease SbcCD subunit C, partial [Deltaproteobacteria bacterium]|nr:nuclease SbcCD subunit C [Deltaproteobacteria bacterium]